MQKKKKDGQGSPRGRGSYRWKCKVKLIVPVGGHPLPALAGLPDGGGGGGKEGGSSFFATPPQRGGGDTQLSRLAQLEARSLREKPENTPKDSCAAKTGNWQAARSVAPLMHRLLARTGRHAGIAQRKTAVRNSAAL